VRLEGRELNGVARNWTVARLSAIKAIDKDQRQTKAAIGKAVRERQ
jgi:hypothetical protein